MAADRAEEWMRGARLKKDMAINIAGAGLKALAMLIIIKLASTMLVPLALGYFLLARRISQTGANALQLGSSRTLIRYVPMNSDEPSRKQLMVLFAVAVWLCLAMVVLALLRAFSGMWTRLLYPEGVGLESVAFWSGGLMIAMSVGYIAQAILLAERRMILSNATELMNVAGFVLIGMALSPRNGEPATAVTVILETQAWGITLLSLAVIGAYVMSLGPLVRPRRGDLSQCAREFLVFGVVRTAVPFLESTVLLVGPWLLRSDPEEAGHLIIALALLRIVQLAIKPVADLASVSVARIMGQGNDATIGEGIKLVFGTALYMTAFAAAVLLPWAKALTQLYLQKPTLVNGVFPYLAVLLWGIVPLMVFSCLKSVIDVRWVPPLNLVTLVVGVAIQVALYRALEVKWGAQAAISAALLAGLWAMGVLTIIWLRNYLKPLSYIGIGRLVGVTVSIGVISLWSAKQGNVLLAVIVVGIAVAGGLAITLCVAPSPFIEAFRQFVIPRKGRVVES